MKTNVYQQSRLISFVWLLVTLLLFLPAAVQAQFTFTTNNGAITITGYTGNPTVLNIPARINGYYVTAIAGMAFANCWSVTNVTIGTNVTSIGGVSFVNCSRLPSITIPRNVSYISYGPFSDCGSLTNISVDDGNPAYSSLDGILFNKNQTTLIQCPGGKTGSYTVPSSVTSIEMYGFFGCMNLTSVAITTNVSMIKSYAFESCTNLTNVIIPDGVTNIANCPWFDCNNLSAITVGSLNPAYCSLDGVLFNKGTNMLIEFPGGKGGSYFVPNTVTNFASSAFWDCKRLTAVTIPDSVISIAGSAFRVCTSLIWVTIGKNVNFIDTYAFNTSAHLTSVYFQGNAPSLASGVFDYDNNATIYYLAGTTGWGPTFGGRPTVLWNPQAQTSDASFGVRTNGFGFTIAGSSNLVIVVESCTNLSNAVWQPVSTNTLNTFIGTNGTSYFSDPQWTNYPGRFYRLRSP